MLWLKAFHIVFMVTWFAGLFYLPRLFVYHADTIDQISLDRFCLMEKRLSGIMSIGAALTIFFGAFMMWAYGASWVAASVWLQIKLILMLGLIGYHGWCQIQIKKFREQRNNGSARYFRLMNEVPGLFLVAIVILAVAKPL